MLPAGTRTLNILDIGRHLESDDIAPPLRALQAAAARLQADLGASAAANVHALKYLSRTAPLKERKKGGKRGGGGGAAVKAPGTPPVVRS